MATIPVPVNEIRWAGFIVGNANKTGSPRPYDLSVELVEQSTAVGDAPQRFAIDAVYPNPFNPLTNISFTLARSGPAQVEIFDLHGGLVRTLWSGELEAGNHSLQWNGTDKVGREVGAGTYVARVRSGNQFATAKLVLAK
jgi:hypothetical protein